MSTKVVQKKNTNKTIVRSNPASVRLAEKHKETKCGWQELYLDIFTKAAILLEAIANYHVFVDGNKRTAITAAARFLFLNGYMFNASNLEVEEIMLSVAMKEMPLEKIATWLKKNSAKVY